MHVNPIKRTRSQPRVGLALGGGGARGWAHLGVFRVFKEEGFRPDLIAGTSIGALAGAVLAADRLHTVEQLASRLDLRHTLKLFAELNLPRAGLVDGRAVERLIADTLDCNTIEELPLPYAAVVTDMLRGERTALTSGDLVQAIRASIAIPGIFTPVQLAGRVLLDGSLVDPLPVDVVRTMGADRVVAIDVNLLAQPTSSVDDAVRPRKGGLNDNISRVLSTFRRILARKPGSMSRTMYRWLEQSEGPNIFEIITRAQRISENQLTRQLLQQSPPDLLIQVPVGHLATLDFHHAEQAIHAGYQAASAQREALRALRP